MRLLAVCLSYKKYFTGYKWIRMDKTMYLTFCYCPCLDTDTINAGNGINVVIGGARADTLKTGAGHDLICGVYETGSEIM